MYPKVRNLTMWFLSRGTTEVQKLRKQGIIKGNERKTQSAETLYR